MANSMLQGDFGVQLPGGVSQSGFVSGHFYYLTASSDESGNYLGYNYFGLTAGQIETLGLPTEIDLASFSGPGGGGDSHFIDQFQQLSECVKRLFGVIQRGFTPSLPGLPGSFVGRGKGGALFTVENDNVTRSQAQLGGVGYTDVYHPYTNYTANDLVPRELGSPNQIHELGHSLAAITFDFISSDAKAEKLVDCVFSHRRK